MIFFLNSIFVCFCHFHVILIPNSYGRYCQLVDARFGTFCFYDATKGSSSWMSMAGLQFLFWWSQLMMNALPSGLACWHGGHAIMASTAGGGLWRVPWRSDSGCELANLPLSTSIEAMNATWASIGSSGKKDSNTVTKQSFPTMRIQKPTYLIFFSIMGIMQKFTISIVLRYFDLCLWSLNVEFLIENSISYLVLCSNHLDSVHVHFSFIRQQNPAYKSLLCSFINEKWCSLHSNQQLLPVFKIGWEREWNLDGGGN